MGHCPWSLTFTGFILHGYYLVSRQPFASLAAHWKYLESLTSRKSDVICLGCGSGARTWTSSEMLASRLCESRCSCGHPQTQTAEQPRAHWNAIPQPTSTSWGRNGGGGSRHLRFTGLPGGWCSLQLGKHSFKKPSSSPPHEHGASNARVRESVSCSPFYL